MKHSFYLMFFFIGCTFLCYSTPIRDSTLYSGIGLAYGNQFETSGEQKIKVYQNSFGIEVTSYQFLKNNSLGFFTHTSLFCPLTSSTTISGTKLKINLWDSYNFVYGMDLTSGLGYRYNINEKIILNAGIGFHTGGSIFYNDYIVLSGLFMGVGSELDIKFKLTNTFGFSLGSNISIDFFNYNGINTASGETTYLAKKYHQIFIQPYICFIYSRYTDPEGNKHWGERNL